MAIPGITTSLLANVYGATDTQIKQNFNNNEKHFEEGKHYFLLKGEELKEFKRVIENFDLPFAEALKFTSQLANCIKTYIEKNNLPDKENPNLGISYQANLEYL